MPGSSPGMTMESVRVLPPHPQPVTPWLDHGVHSASVSASRNPGGMDAGIKSRHDDGWWEWRAENSEQNPTPQEKILDKRNKMFYVCSIRLPPRGVAREPSGHGEADVALRSCCYGQHGPGCGCVLAQGSGYYGPDARKRL